MAQRRASGEPLAYITGRAMFMGVELLVDPGALIPREETELLGENALALLRARPSDAHRVIDMCCGSGNLACALAHHAPSAHIWASDLTPGCVDLAQRNATHIGVADRVHIGQGDLFEGLLPFGLTQPVDLVVCNPPYISQGKLAGEKATLLNHEPREAFDGGPYGLSIHQRVIRDAVTFLQPGGTLMFEIGLGQERQLEMLFHRVKNYENVQMVKNCQGDVRVVSAVKRAQ
jgi:release factor glutamine methyltransferase